MNVLILIMGCNCNPGARNIDAIFNTYIKSYNDNKNLFNHNYDFIVYKGDYSEAKLNNNVLQLTSPDNIESTYNKTIEAFNYIKNFEFDYIIRVNISTYINLFVLDNYIETFKNDIIYCNSICTYFDSIKYKNFIFPRGDAYIMHKSLFEKILDVLTYYNPYDDDLTGIDNTDDSMFGLLCNKYFEKNLQNHIQILNYSFIPQMVNEITNYNIKLSALSIFSRLKTCPHNTHSGYSWDDNLYRLHDVKKFELLNVSMFILKNRIGLIYNDNLDENSYFIKNDNNEFEFVSFNYIRKMLNER